MGPTLIYRTFFARALAWAAALMSAFAVVFFLITGGIGELARSGGISLLLLTLVWALFEYPAVIVSDGGVTVRNIMRTIHVPWPAYQGVDTAWQLRLRTTEGDVSSWAIPAPSRMEGGPAASQDVVANPVAVEAALAAGSQPVNVWRGVNAVVVAGAVKARHEALTAQGWLKRGQPNTGLEHSWNSRMLLAVASAAVLALLGLALG